MGDLGDLGLVFGLAETLAVLVELLDASGVVGHGDLETTIGNFSLEPALCVHIRSRERDREERRFGRGRWCSVQCGSTGEGCVVCVLVVI